MITTENLLKWIQDSVVLEIVKDYVKSTSYIDKEDMKAILGIKEDAYEEVSSEEVSSEEK